MNHFTKWAAAAALATAGSAALAEGLFTPNLSYRTGPFAATGIPLMNGQADYMNMLNARDGGIGGVMIDFEECETTRRSRCRNPFGSRRRMSTSKPPFV